MGSKLIRRLSFTSASPHDSTQTEALLSGDERAIFGDKAYPGKDLKIRCRQQGIYYGILDKAYRNTPLSGAQKARNTRKRRVRRYGEHPFSAIKQRYGMDGRRLRQDQTSQQGPVYHECDLLEY